MAYARARYVSRHMNMSLSLYNGPANSSPQQPSVSGSGYTTSGYTRGGAAAAWPGARGISGFDGADFMVGKVRGFRWWTFTAPDLAVSPATSGWQPGPLHGVMGPWHPGLNHAECRASGSVPVPGRHPAEAIPEINCGCGFWAYWDVQHHDMGRSHTLPVTGVIEGTGNVLVGEKGFRAQQARIVALHVPLKIELVLPGQAMWRAWHRHPRFHGQVIDLHGRPSGPGDTHYPPVTEPSEREIAEAADAADAWTAIIGDRIGQAYPDAEICETLAYMVSKYPSTREDAPQE